MAEVAEWAGRMGGRILDLLYPRGCGVCGEVREGEGFLCEECDGGLPRLAAPFCRRCGEHFEGAIEGEFVCPNCSGLAFSFEFARPAMFLNGETRRMIHEFKYGRRIHLAEPLARLLTGAFEDPRLGEAIAEKWPLVPVPLHPSREAWRYFNQAREIARPLAGWMGLPMLDGLKRVRKTETQTHLSRAQRLRNLRDAFRVSRAGARWADKAGAVLVDDVLTTGSTVDACAKALRKAGFRRVAVVVVMRG